jgi:polyribonucleotide 5'-hydroxyl-kinase
VYSPLPTSSPANPLGSAATSVPTTLSSNALLPLAYWYGHAETTRNPLLMDRLIRNMGENVNDKYEFDPEGAVVLFRHTTFSWNSQPGRASGLIVDTPSSFASGPGSGDHRQKLIKACVEAFKSQLHLPCATPIIFRSSLVNVILVVGHEKLNVEMQRAYGASLTIVKIPKSGGVSQYFPVTVFILQPLLQVVELDHAYRERVHNCQLHTYMYGQIIPPPPGITSASLGGELLTDLVLSPSSTVINFDDLSIFRIGAGMTRFFAAFVKRTHSGLQRLWRPPLPFLSALRV